LGRAGKREPTCYDKGIRNQSQNRRLRWSVAQKRSRRWRRSWYRRCNKLEWEARISGEEVEVESQPEEKQSGESHER